MDQKSLETGSIVANPVIIAGTIGHPENTVIGLELVDHNVMVGVPVRVNVG